MRILTTLLLMLVTALPGLAATTYPAGTNVANTFFRTNAFRDTISFGTSFTNVLTQGGSKINGVGLTNGVMTADTLTLDELDVGTLVVTNKIDGTNIAGAVPLATISVGATNDDAGAKISTTYYKSGSVFQTNSIGITVDGGGSAVTTGVKGFVEVPYACTIEAATMLADQVGGCGINVWRTNSTGFPPTAAGKISGAATPVLTATNWMRDSTLTGWTKTLAAGDILGFNVESNATITRLTLQLKVTH